MNMWNNNTVIEEDKILQNVGLELMFSTPESRENSEGLTAIELSRKLGVKIEIVKKKLRILHEKGIARCVGISPKFWLFDDYNFLRMDEEDPVYLLLCSFDDVDFDKFFCY